ITAHRVALRAASGTVEVGRSLLGIPNQNVERARRATIGERLAVQPGGDVGNVRGAQRELWHAPRRNAILNDRRDDLSMLIGENHLIADQVRSRLSASGVGAMAEAAVAPEELLATRILLRRSGRTHWIVRCALGAGATAGRCRRAWRSLRQSE